MRLWSCDSSSIHTLTTVCVTWARDAALGSLSLIGYWVIFLVEGPPEKILTLDMNHPVYHSWILPLAAVA